LTFLPQVLAVWCISTGCFAGQLGVLGGDFDTIKGYTLVSISNTSQNEQAIFVSFNELSGSLVHTSCKNLAVNETWVLSTGNGLRNTVPVTNWEGSILVYDSTGLNQFAVGAQLVYGTETSINLEWTTVASAPAPNCTSGDLDFGDAPEPTYPTLLGSDGARHVIGGSLVLGRLVDAETDGQADKKALGDDLSGVADEDGVVFNDRFTPGSSSDISIKTTGAGYLNAWFDFNGNGDWANAGEQVLLDEQLTGPGTYLFSIPVPAGASAGTTFARFRLNTEGALGFTGPASDGEVEDYEITIEAGPGSQLDFGDAPDPAYPTLFATNGARHIIPAGGAVYFLGNQVDSEADGQPDSDASGDDNNNSMDEDGVVFLDPIVAKSTVRIQISASMSGYLNAWADLNGDGDWDDVGETIFADSLLNSGINILAWELPGGSLAGEIYTRFRFASYSALEYNGLATDGEVEDYLIRASGLFKDGFEAASAQ